MEHKNEGLVQMIFLFNWVIFRFHDNFEGLPSLKLTWPLKIGLPKRKFIGCSSNREKFGFRLRILSVLLIEMLEG